MKNVALFLLIGLELFVQSGCKSSTDTAQTASPLSGTLYFTNTENLFAVNLSSGTITTMAHIICPNVLPDKSILGVNDAGDLVELSANGASTTTILQHYGSGYAAAFQDPQLSPDGKYIAYDDVAYHVYVIDLSGQLLVAFGDGTNSRYIRPVWGPGDTLYMEGRLPTEGIYEGFDNGSTQLVNQDLSHPTRPSVSPDGTKIAFIMDQHLWTMHSDGTGVQQIANGVTTQNWTVWSPDGKWIMTEDSQRGFVAYARDGSSSVSLYDLFPDLRSLTYEPQVAYDYDWK